MRKKIPWLAGFLLLSSCLQAQLFHAGELLEFVAYPTKKFDQYISKKGFIASGHFLQRDSVIDSWDLIQPPADSNALFVHRRVSRYQNKEITHFSFQSSDPVEIQQLLAEMKQQGFTSSDSSWAMTRPVILQRREWLVQAERMREDTVDYILLRWRQQPMPGNRRIAFADDLLQFHSDEYLAAYFGRQNVKKDQFYFSEKELRRCSILFPNTPNQAIFVWENDTTLMGIEQIMIGGGLRTENTEGYSGVVSNNSWRLRNGIRTHMTLDQLTESAGADLQFFGRQSEFYLTITPESAKKLELDNVALILECINCVGVPGMDRSTISAVDASRAGLRLHVSMMVLWPGEAHQKISSFSTIE